MHETKQRKLSAFIGMHSNPIINRNILIGAGSDAGSPCTSHRALLDELYTMYEMISDAKEVLKSATVNAGKILGSDVGQIKEGYRANLILLKENPLECLSNLESIEMVVIRGKALMKHANKNLEIIAE
ncbi:amidohydrolase family protein [Cytobacillus sp.]|uniref:amidohydrolase family protein n=1 Tax=Cytobacillus sp. TaxID=2675269 RepID=UPI003518BE42